MMTDRVGERILKVIGKFGFPISKDLLCRDKRLKRLISHLNSVNLLRQNPIFRQASGEKFGFGTQRLV